MPIRKLIRSVALYCRLNNGRVHVAVVFNLTRFARDKYDHFALRLMGRMVPATNSL